jgi:AmmeMemoRadiSam system protein B
VVILGPNHHGVGAAISVSKDDWQTPLGAVKTDVEVGEYIVAALPEAQWDEIAHRQEHSIEVQIPFLQYIYGKDFKILAISLARQTAASSRALGEAIASALGNKRGLIIASSDFTHYEAQASASSKDKLALDAILGMGPEQLEETVKRHGISMCGPGPIMTMLTACALRGAKDSRLLTYATSGDITGDPSRVVGYASVEITL